MISVNHDMPRRMPSRQSLRIYQANVGRGGPAHDAALSIAYDNHLDIVAIQEPWIFGDLTARKTKTHPSYQAFSPLSTWTSRPRVLIYIHKGIPLSPSQPISDICRDVICVTVSLYANKTINIYNIYNSPAGSEDAGSGLHHTLNIPINDNPLLRPSIVVGDFNIRHRDWDHTTHQAPYNGDQLVDWASRQDLYLLNPDQTATHSRGGTLDLSFSSMPLASCIVAHDLSTGSDHETLVTTLPLTSTSTMPDRGRLRYAACNLELFNQLLRPFSSPVSMDPEEEAADIVRCLKLALEGACPRSTGNGKIGAPWWTPECAQSHRRYVTARRYRPAVEERKHFRAMVRQAKKNYWKAQIEEASTLPDIYRITRWPKMQPRFHSPPLEHPVTGEMANTPAQKAEALHSALLSRHLDTADISPDSPAVPRREIHWPAFNMQEVYRATCQTASTAPGADEIPAKAIRQAWPIIGRRVQGLFQACVDRGLHPRVFKHANVVILAKSGPRNRSLPKSYRPIALLSCLGKGFERLIARRLSYYALNLGILSRDQCSAVSKRSATDLTTALACDIQQAWKAKLVAGIVTVDVQGAFDGVLKNRLLQRLREQGWPLGMIRWTASFFEDRTACIRLDDSLSTPFPVISGLPQGSPVSPILFLLYVEPLLRLSSGRFGYADDACFLVTGRNLDRVSNDLQEALDGTLAWGQENGISFETKKTELQYFHRKNKFIEPPLRIGANIITPNTNTRWLGVHFDRKLSFKEHVNRARVRCRIITDHIKKLNGTRHGAGPGLLRRAVESCAFSSLLYGAETWFSQSTPQHIISQIQVAMNLAARAVLPVYRTTPVPALLREVGWAPASAWLERAHDRLTVRIAAADPSHPLRHRWKSDRFAWIRRNIPCARSPDVSTAPWATTDRPAIRAQIGAVGRETGLRHFEAWLSREVSATDILVFSDGSRDDQGRAGASYCVYANRGEEMLQHATIPLGDTAEVFDAEVIGATTGLEAAQSLQWADMARNIYVILDNEEAAMRLQSEVATPTSAREFRKFQGLRDAWAKRDRGRWSFRSPGRTIVKWCPGHKGIPGNESADVLAKRACSEPSSRELMTIARASKRTEERYQDAIASYWEGHAPTAYRNLKIQMSHKIPFELRLRRSRLGYLIAARTGHGDFAEYHRRFHHEDADLLCRCGDEKSQTHFFTCRNAIPNIRSTMSASLDGGRALSWLLGTAKGAALFAKWCDASSFYER